MATKQGNAQMAGYGASFDQMGQAAGISGIENPAYSGQHTPGVSGQHTYIQMTGVQPALNRPAPNGPVVVTELEPQTQYSLIWSTFSAIFCFLACGVVALGVSWQARLQVLDGKYRHARHSLTVANILNCIALLFGLLIWGLFTWMFILITSVRY